MTSKNNNITNVKPNIKKVGFISLKDSKMLNSVGVNFGDSLHDMFVHWQKPKYRNNDR